MRFTVSSTALSSRLEALSRVINSKSSLPIWGDFLFEVVSDDTLHAEQAETIQETDPTVTNQVSETKVKIRKQNSSRSIYDVFTDSITLQSDNSYAERGYHQQDYTQEEGNNAQRGRCKARQAVFRVLWSGGGHERIQRHKGDVLRPDPRMVRYRRRSAGLLLGEEKTGSGGCWRVRAANQSDVGRRTGKEWYCCQSIKFDVRKQSAGTLLFVNTNNNWRA